MKFLGFQIYKLGYYLGRLGCWMRGYSFSDYQEWHIQKEIEKRGLK